MTHATYDYVLVGGGLQSGLVALALADRRPGSRFVLVERDNRLGGNHTWCFHEGDIPAEARPWVAPLVSNRWPGYEVMFPGGRRRIESEYAAIPSDRFHDVVSRAVAGREGGTLMMGETVVDVDAGGVTLEGGGRLSGDVVIDARGPGRPTDGVGAGYQKFVGLEVELSRPHGIDLPMLMDATVDQSEGFRFVYLLPFDDMRILIEDTYFSDTPGVDRETLGQRIRDYAGSRGLEIARVVRDEFGVLPMPWSGSLPRPGSGPLVAGYAGGWFHPGTGYSLPVAVRLAETIASSRPGELASRVAALARDVRRQSRFCHALNAFLFRWYAPHDRRHIFERFYRLPADTIERFFALRMTMGDRLRIMSGRPPRGFSVRYRMGTEASR